MVNEKLSLNFAGNNEHEHYVKVACSIKYVIWTRVCVCAQRTRRHTDIPRKVVGRTKYIRQRQYAWEFHGFMNFHVSRTKSVKLNRTECFAIVSFSLSSLVIHIHSVLTCRQMVLWATFFFVRMENWSQMKQKSFVMTVQCALVVVVQRPNQPFNACRYQW